MSQVENMPLVETNLTPTEEKLVRMVSNAIGMPATTTDTWTDLGVDSLTMAELVMDVEDEFHVTLDDRVFGVDCIAQMAAFLDRERTAA
jgi:acyl carrier protein